MNKIYFGYLLFIISCTNVFKGDRYYYKDVNKGEFIQKINLSQTDLSFTVTNYLFDSSLVVEGNFKNKNTTKLDVLNMKFEFDRKIPDTFTIIKYNPLEIYHCNNFESFVKKINSISDTFICFSFELNKFYLSKDISLKFNSSIKENSKFLNFDTTFKLK